MTFLRAIRSGFKGFGTFTGRASRSEFWYWVLFVYLGCIAFIILDMMMAALGSTLSPATTLFELGVFIPTLAVQVRRLHDVDRSGWWVLMYFTIIGYFFPLLYWLCKRGTEGANRFGPDPLDVHSERIKEVFT